MWLVQLVNPVPVKEPMTTLQPPVIKHPEKHPKKMLLQAVVLQKPAQKPAKKLLDPVVIQAPALHPTKKLLAAGALVSMFAAEVLQERKFDVQQALIA